MPAPTVTIDLDQFTTFGDLLKFLRRRAGLTQRELSIAVGYSVPQISRLEQNQRLPDLAMISARFMPALDLADEPEAGARMLALAAAMRREDAPAPGLSPYKGLLYFDEADAELFFGREALTEKLAARFIEPLSRPPRFLAVVGASGSGKSSLVRAGLIPALHWRPSGVGWPVFVLTPTARPLEALAASLNPDGKANAASLKLAATLAHNPAALGQQLGPAPGVLVVDQFEELFTLCRDDLEQKAFVDSLLAACAEPGLATVIVIALRADFYAHCAQFAALREMLANHQEFIGPMTADELRRAIEEPARRGRWELEPGLVEVLLKDVGSNGSHALEPGALPLVSHALLETWLRRRGQTLTLSGYAASGGVQGAIAETAEAVFHDQLDPAQRGIARQIFLRLTELGEDGGTADTRRRVALTELIPDNVEAGAVRAVLQTLADARLITTEQDAVEVAHEALIREWPTLRGWLEDDRQGLRQHRGLTEAAREWERLGREPGALYRGVKLAQAMELASADGRAPGLNALEREFLSESQSAAEREAIEREAARQRELEAAQRLAQVEKAHAAQQTRAASQLRRRALYLLGAFVLAVALAGAALYFGDQARQIAAAAQAASRLATARELAAEAVNNLDVNPELSVLLALQGVSLADLPETAGALHQAVMADRVQLTLMGHQAEVYTVAYSQDGKRLATASQDHTAKIWDAATGKLLLTLYGHSDSVNGVAFSPDGTRLATTSDDHTAKVWDAASGRALLTLNHGNIVYRVAFSPDGLHLATTSEDGSTRVWDAKSGEQQFELISDVPFIGLAYSPDGTRLATTILYGPLQIWDAATGDRRQTLPNDSNSESRAVAFSPDGRWVAAARGAQVKVWDVTSGQELLTLAGHTNVVRAVAFSPDGKRLVTGAIDRKVIVWDTVTGQQLFALAGHSGPINGAAFSPDGQQVATASWDHTAKVWDLTPAHELLTITTPTLVPGHNAVLALSPDGKRLAVTTSDFSAQVFDANSGRSLLALPRQANPIKGLAYSKDGAQIATASSNVAAGGAVTLWDAVNGRSPLTLTQRAIFGIASLNGIAFSPDGSHLAVGADNDLSLWDPATNSILWAHPDSAHFFQDVAFSPDGTHLAVATNSASAVTLGVVTLWDAATGQQLSTLAGHTEAVEGVAFNRDGTRLATGSDDGTAKIWDAATGKELLTLAGHTGGVVRVVFSPDGARVATASLDGTARLWDTATGQELLTLYGDRTEMDDLAFSPDGASLYTVTDEAVRVYALKIEDLVALAKARVRRSLIAAECQQYLHVAACPP